MGQNIIHAIGLLMIGTIFSKLLGFFREITFVHQFGAGAVSDAFLLTNSIPGIMFSAVALAINMNFIPLYMRFERNEERNRFASNLLNLCLLFSLTGIVVINLLPVQTLWLFANRLPEETLRYAVPMLRIVSVSILPILLTQLFQAYSQANNCFLSTAMLGVLTNIVLIVSYLIATNQTFILLSVGCIMAQFVAMAMTFYQAKQGGFHYVRVLKFNDSHIVDIAILTFPLMFGKFSEDASLLVDRNLAAGIGTGVLSSLAYASLLANAASSMIINSIVTAAFPVFARLVADGQREVFTTVFEKFLRLLWYALCPISVFMMVFADDIVVCFLQHGVLHNSAARIIWEATACYAAGIVPFGIQNYVIRSFYAFQDTKTPTYIVTVSLLCNIGFSILSVPYWGHIGITSATSISYFISGILLMYIFVRKYKITISKSLSTDVLFVFVTATFLGAGVYWLFRIVGVTDSLFIRVAFESGLYFTLYIGLLLIAHKELLPQISSLVKKR